MQEIMKTVKLENFKPDEKFLKDKNILNAILNNVPQYMFWKDVNSVFMGCNKAFADILGFDDPKDIIGKTDFDVASPDKAAHFIEVDKKIIKNKKAISNMAEFHCKKNGDRIWVNINKTPIFDEDGNVTGIFGTFEDITERIDLIERLKTNAKKYKTLIESTGTAYMILNTQLDVIDSNELMAKLLGLEYAEELKGMNTKNFVSKKSMKKFEKEFQLALLNNGYKIQDLEIFTTKNKILNINASYIENGDKKIFCLARDITEKKMIESKTFVEDQKKKDRIKQNITELRNDIKQLLTIGENT